MRQIILAFSAFVLMCGAAVANPVADFIACDANKDGLLQKADSLLTNLWQLREVFDSLWYAQITFPRTNRA